MKESYRLCQQLASKVTDCGVWWWLHSGFPWRKCISQTGFWLLWFSSNVAFLPWVSSVWGWFSLWRAAAADSSISCSEKQALLPPLSLQLHRALLPSRGHNTHWDWPHQGSNNALDRPLFPRFCKSFHRCVVWFLCFCRPSQPPPHS